MRKLFDTACATVGPTFALAIPARAAAAAEVAIACCVFALASAAFVRLMISAVDGVGGIAMSRAGMSMFISGMTIVCFGR